MSACSLGTLACPCTLNTPHFSRSACVPSCNALLFSCIKHVCKSVPKVVTCVHAADVLAACKRAMRRGWASRQKRTALAQQSRRWHQSAPGPEMPPAHGELLKRIAAEIRCLCSVLLLLSQKRTAEVQVCNVRRR
eukprot:351375-Chlamydomonas_euryale.AAC.29